MKHTKVAGYASEDIQFLHVLLTRSKFMLMNLDIGRFAAHLQLQIPKKPVSSGFAPMVPVSQEKSN